MAKKTKKKKKLKMPPLSFLDKVVYWIALSLLIGLCYFFLVVQQQMRRAIAFDDMSIIASGDNFSACWFLVPVCTLFVITFILWETAYQNRKPIFGKKNIKYGPPAFPKVYPLFMKNKPYVYVGEGKKKEYRLIATIILVVFLISLVPFPWSLYGRYCLKNDGSIVQYNMFNKQVQDFSSEEIESIKIDTYRVRNSVYRKNWISALFGIFVDNSRWGVQMEFVTESGKKYTFDDGGFRKDTSGKSMDWLMAMNQVKANYDPSVICYEDIESLHRVIEDEDMTQEEIELLYRLFGLQ